MSVYGTEGEDCAFSMWSVGKSKGMKKSKNMSEIFQAAF